MQFERAMKVWSFKNGSMAQKILSGHKSKPTLSRPYKFPFVTESISKWGYNIRDILTKILKYIHIPRKRLNACLLEGAE